MGNILNLLYDNLYDGKYRIPNGLDRFTEEKLISKMDNWKKNNEFNNLKNAPMNDIQTNIKIGPFISTDILNNFEIKYYNVSQDLPLSRNYIYVIELLHQRGLYFSIMNISDKVIDMVNENKCKVIINYEHEGRFDYEFFNRWYNELFQDLEQFIKLENFYIFTGDLNCAESISEECKINFFPSTHFVDNIAVESFNLKNNNEVLHNELNYEFKVRSVKDIDLSIKNKFFLSYMRNCNHTHRKCLASYYEYNKLWDSNIISFLKGDWTGKEFEMIPNCLPKKYHDSCVKLNDRDVIEIDTFDVDDKFGFGTSYTDKWDFYQETFLSVVTETLFDDSEIFISEKSVKPILNLHPFILISTPKTLQKLRELGFKTFHPFIDESYDNEKDNTIRIQKIFDELDKFSNRSINDLIEWWNQIIPILKHNQNHLFSMVKNKSDKVKLLKNISSGVV